VTPRDQLRQTLAPYKGGRFTSAENGGAAGMVFFKDQGGREFYVGSLQSDHAQNIAEALTLSIKLLATTALPRTSDRPTESR
jgi:hypothetical protein